MPKPRKPQPSDLLTSRDLVDIYGFRLRTAENIVSRIARAHGGPVEVIVDGVPIRRVFVRRDWVEASIGQRAS